MKSKVIIGIDLAGKTENPTGWALLEDKTVKVSITYTDKKILEGIVRDKPEIIAIDAPFNLPKKGMLRKADAEMMRKGYHVFSPSLQGMRKLTMRATKLNRLISEKGYRTIEVHPTSTCKALNMPLKNWKEIQTILTQIGLKGDVALRTLTLHEIDAITAAFTAYLHMQNQTEAIGNEEEGYIIVPKKQDWRTLKV